MLDDARAEAARIHAEGREEAERIRDEADAYAEERRRAAEEDAKRLWSQAEAEARSLLAGGEEIRRRIEQRLAHQQQLRAQWNAVDARLHEVVQTPRAIAADLERVLNGKREGARDDTTDHAR